MNSKIKNKRNWYLVTFGALLSVPVLALLIGMLLTPLYNAARMQFWEPVEAAVFSAEIKNRKGDSGLTHQTTANYAYEVNGRFYGGDRVSLHNIGDNLGGYQHRMMDKLSRSGKTLMVYYNPANPQESIIDRSLRWGMMCFFAIFVVLFGGLSFVALRTGWRGKDYKS